MATATADGIQLQGLAKSFSSPQGVVRAVDGIDVSIAAGETVALLGPNGASPANGLWAGTGSCG